MSSKTKIVVLHMKEIIYTAIFVILGVLFILLLVFMFFPKNKKSLDTTKEYTPGIYTSTVSLNNTDLEIEVTVEQSKIASIRCVNLSESVTTMYPLLQPVIENIAEQVCEKQSTKNITYPKDNPYTSQMIVSAIENALKKASVK
ncbi:FMN-binding protein [Faecalimonas sp.]